LFILNNSTRLLKCLTNTLLRELLNWIKSSQDAKNPSCRLERLTDTLVYAA
jgi:hypothetical protein